MISSRYLGLPLVLTLAAALPGPAPAQADRPVLRGEWRFVPERSDDPEAKLRGKGPGFGGGTIGGRTPRGGGGGGRAPEELVNPLELLRAPQQLAIQQDDSSVTMGIDLGPRRPLYFDGRVMVDTLSDFTVRESVARWKKGRLEIDRKAGRYARIRESYWVDPAQDVLIVEVVFEGLRKVELRRIYRRPAAR